MKENTAKKVFAKNLKWYMNEYGLNQNDIARITGVSQQSVTDWLNRRQIPRFDVIDKLAIFFNISKSDFLEETNEQSDKIRIVFMKNFKRIMNEKHKRPAQIARDLNLPLSTVAGWANGSSYPRIDNMQKLADYLNVDLIRLIAIPNHSVEVKMKKKILSYLSCATEDKLDGILKYINNDNKKRD